MSASKQFDKLLEKSTSALLLEPDWDSIIKLCDLIRQGDVQAKYAVSQVKKKLNNDNVHTVSFSLQQKQEPMKTKILELIQCWAHAFKKNPNLKIVEDYYNTLKYEGAKFPRLNESEAMFDVEEAPQWIHDSDANECLRCRAEFGPIRRRHHCRACGQIFCGACSSKTAPIPKFGIEKEVRVCDACYDKLMGVSGVGGSGGMSSSSSSSSGQVPFGQSSIFGTTSKSSDLLSSASASAAGVPPNLSSGRPAEKTEQEFEEELQLAMALSESEAEANKKQQQQRLKQQYNTKSSSSSSGPLSALSNSNLNITAKSSSSSNKLSAYGGSEAPPSAPYAETASSSQSVTSTTTSSSGSSKKKNKSQTKMPVIESQPRIGIEQFEDNGELGAENGGGENGGMAMDSEANSEEARTDREIVQFRTDLKRLLDIYVNRMRSDSMRGRSITNDTAVQSLFLQLQHLHPRLLAYIKYKEDARAYYELLQDKLTQLKDAREALNALRQETYEKKRLEMEERERQRQMQIAHKLQLMRAQKQSYYMMQNQANLRRLQEQERDLRTRLEQQRDMVQKREITTTSVPFMSATGGPMQMPLGGMQMPGSMLGAGGGMGGYGQVGGMMPGAAAVGGMDMQMIESSLESLRLQQAYLMQQQQQQQQPAMMVGSNGMGPGGLPGMAPPSGQQHSQPQFQQPPPPQQQQQQQQQSSWPQQQAQIPQQYYEQQMQQPQQAQMGYGQQHQPAAQQHQSIQQAVVAAPIQPQVQQEQPKVAELISFD